MTSSHQAQTKLLSRWRSAFATTRRSLIKQSAGAAAAALAVLLTAAICSAADLPDKPNVLFIAVDDLNHWVTHLGRNPQARTPNIDRLASQGVTFTNAHCAAPACNPSRLALMSGRRPWVTGCYQNWHGWMNHQAAGEGLSAQFLRAGYHVAGAGKIYHGFSEGYPSEWSEYMPTKGLSKNGPGVSRNDGYLEDVVHPDLKDQDIIDWHTVDYCIERISQKSNKPFFVACGIYKPHLPLVAPRKYYEAFPLDEIELPPHREDDLDDIPPSGVRMAKINEHRQFLESGRWKAAIQSYLATCAYTDMNVDRLLDALEKSPNKDNTIVCLWSDHGWALGEKQNWRKFSLWEETTRCVYIWVVPGLTPQGARCHRPVDLMSVYPTLCELAGVPVPDHVSGSSIIPLLKDPDAKWDLPAITTFGRGNHSIKTATHRYTRYQDGDEELYHVTEDPYEWENLASRPESLAIKQELAEHLPALEAPELPQGK